MSNLNNENSCILKFKQKSVHPSEDGLALRKIIGSISPKEFVKLLKHADNQVNPRTAKENKITKSIIETLIDSPEIFFFKNKGILIATETFDDSLDRDRAKMTFTNTALEGIMDGGHTTLSIATHILKDTIGIKVKNWSECKNAWMERYEDILTNLENSNLNYSIPVEIITPDYSRGDTAINDYEEYITEICEGRNNNVQLTETSKGHHKGLYKILENNLSNHSIVWRKGESGNLKSEDVIALACLGLIFLQEKEELPSEYSLNKIALYNQKGKCIDYFNKVLSDENISLNEGKDRIVVSNSIESALKLTEDIMKFFDKLYLEFPNLYHNAAPGKFGRIKSVENKESKVPYLTTATLSTYKYSPGYLYPILCSLTKLMQIDPKTKNVSWIVNPNSIDLSKIDMKSITELIKTVNFDPVKVGKSILCYNLGERMFDDYLNKYHYSINPKELKHSNSVVSNVMD